MSSTASLAPSTQTGSTASVPNSTAHLSLPAAATKCSDDMCFEGAKMLIYVLSYFEGRPVLYLSGVRSLERVLDGVQRQCVNPAGRPRVRPSHSAIHCCLVFLSASPPPFFALGFLPNHSRLFRTDVPLLGFSSFCSARSFPRIRAF